MDFTKEFLDSINIEDWFKKAEKKSSFKFQASYLSNYVYGGRKDSLALPYFTPSIEYNHKSGFYAGASFGLLPNTKFNKDFISINAGFSFDTSNHFGCSVFANKLFYSVSSKNVQSTVNFTLGTAISYYTKIVNLSSTISTMFGSKTDFALTFSLDHTFDFANDTSNYALSMVPTLSTYFGSTGFYQSTKSKGRIGNFPPGTTFALVSPEKFQMLSYEFSIPIYFDKEKWGVSVIPTYAIAVNPVITSYRITLPNGGVFNPKETITETISNSFFVDLGFYYRF
ncbi:MAG: hypothetical protein ACOVO1_02755 [Chitinophagaceae bacterium]